jgi:hypothetical protein
MLAKPPRDTTEDRRLPCPPWYPGVRSVPPQGLELETVVSVDGLSKPDPQKFEDVDDVG